MYGVIFPITYWDFNGFWGNEAKSWNRMNQGLIGRNMYSYTLMLEKWGNSHYVRVLNHQVRSFENRILEWVSISYFVKALHFTIVLLNIYFRMRECGYYNNMSWDGYSSILEPKNIFDKSGNRCSFPFNISHSYIKYCCEKYEYSRFQSGWAFHLLIPVELHIVISR